MASFTTSFDNKMSLYIPRCDTRSLPRMQRGQTETQYHDSIKEFIIKQFKFQNIGDVERVDLVPKKTPDGYVYMIAFLHFDTWYDTDQAKALQADILAEGSRAKLQFHERWFWICNKNNKPLAAEEVDLAKKMYEQEQQILHLQAQLAHAHHHMQGWMVPQHMPPQLAPPIMQQQYQYSDGQFPPMQAPSLVRQTNDTQPRDA